VLPNSTNVYTTCQLVELANDSVHREKGALVTQRILIDCDPGIDDALAILAALGSGRFQIEAITSVPGNVPADLGAANAQKVLHLAGRADIPVARGALQPLRGTLPADPFSHGPGGLAGIHLASPEAPLDSRTAADAIVDAAQRHPGQLTILALGPMTNLALALEIDPELPSKVASVVAIAGLFGFNEHAWRYATGDNPVSEWNVYVDPEAARRVVHAGFNLTLLSLDVTTHPDNGVSDAMLERLATGGPAAQFMTDVVKFVVSRGFLTYCSLIDPLAVAFAARPDLFETADFDIDVDTEGRLSRGQTVIDRRVHFRWAELAQVSIVVKADHATAIDFVCDTILAVDTNRLDSRV
jgi:inosine-uridine nucleoside N-ribohydrolase